MLHQQLIPTQSIVLYAGGNKGMMGAVARTVFDGLGEGSVIGVIPEALKEIEVRLSI
jgi:predicted Rossmann-fold nucleotide-binding protein